MSDPQNSIDPRLSARLDALKHAPPRDPANAARGRAQFLAHASTLKPRAQPAQRGFLSRLAYALALVLVLLIVTTGTTVYAAQDALPNDALYPVKLWSEDARLALTNDSSERATVLLNYADRRAAEITATSASGGAVPERTLARLQAQIENALALSAQLDDANLTRQLTAQQQQLATWTNTLEQAQSNAPAEVAPVLERTRGMLHERRELVETGLREPALFRARLLERAQTPLPPPTAWRTPLPPATPTLPRPSIVPATASPRPSEPPSTLPPRSPAPSIIATPNLPTPPRLGTPGAPPTEFATRLATPAHTPLRFTPPPTLIAPTMPPGFTPPPTKPPGFTPPPTFAPPPGVTPKPQPGNTQPPPPPPATKPQSNFGTPHR